jgi:hypothetical protein
MLSARGILAALSVGFLVFAFLRMRRRGNARDAAARTWLIIGVIFAIVSAWLWFAASSRG